MFFRRADLKAFKLNNKQALAENHSSRRIQMDFESIYKMNEAVQESEQLADDMPQDITVSEEALNIAMNQISLIIDGFKKDNYIQQMMQFYDNKPKKESSEQESDMEHLTEAKKGTFAFYYKLLIKSNSNMAKKIKIAAIILVLLAVILGVTVAVNWDKIKNSMNSVKTKKLADSTAANLAGSTGMLNGAIGATGVVGATSNAEVDANAATNGTANDAQTSTDAKEELTNNQVNDTKPMSNLGGMTTHQWVQSKKDAGLSKAQIEEEYEKEGYSRHGPKFIAAMTAIFGGVSIATLTAVSPTTASATGVTADNQSAVIDTKTYTADIVPPEEKQQKEAEINQEIEQNPEAAEQVADEMKTEEKADGAEDSQMDKEGTEGKADSEAEIDWSNPSAVWSNAVQTGNGEISKLPICVNVSSCSVSISST